MKAGMDMLSVKDRFGSAQEHVFRRERRFALNVFSRAGAICVVEPRPAERWGLLQVKISENGLARKMVIFLSGRGRMNVWHECCRWMSDYDTRARYKMASIWSCL